jgi:hypothetical protein
LITHSDVAAYDRDGVVCLRMMDSGSADFFYDQLFAKEPGTAHLTPWHQD